jgi:enoyl-CoA hydratase
MTVRVETSDDVTTVVIDRPQARNAVDPPTAEALVAAFVAFEHDARARVAVLCGAGDAFCAGYDLEHAATLDAAGPLDALDIPPDGPPPRGPMGPTRLMLSKPVIAGMAGPAVAGGLELALWCDLRVMEEDAYVGVFCRRWGIPLIDGGTVRLPRIVGRGRALDLILTGRKVTAEECHRIGLCDRIVARGQGRAAAEALAREIASFPPECVRADRRSVYRQEQLPLEEAMRFEWQNGHLPLITEGLPGARRFARRHD